MNPTTDGRCPMIESFDELKKIVAWARKQQLKSLTVNGIHFEFNDRAFTPRKITKPSDILKKARTMAEELDDDKLLFWSAGSKA